MILLCTRDIFCIVARALADNQYQVVVRGLEVLGQLTPSSYRCAQSPNLTCIAAELADFHAAAWYWVAGEAIILVA